MSRSRYALNQINFAIRELLVRIADPPSPNWTRLAFDVALV
jgi:hypothetical protein